MNRASDVSPLSTSSRKRAKPSAGVSASRTRRTPSTSSATDTICDRCERASKTSTCPPSEVVLSVSGVPSPTSLPLLMISTRLHVDSTSGRMWVETSTVFSPAMLRMRSRTCRIWFGSSPAVGSSKISSCGSATNASARPTRDRYPLESWPMIRERTSATRAFSKAASTHLLSWPPRMPLSSAR